MKSKVRCRLLQDFAGRNGYPRAIDLHLVVARASGGTSCSNTRFVSIAWSAPSSRQRQSAITSSRITATLTNSGSALSSRFASHVTTARRGSSKSTVSAPILALMACLWIRAIPSTVAGGDTRSRASRWDLGGFRAHCRSASSSCRWASIPTHMCRH